MRDWLNKCDEDGFSNADAIITGISIFIAFVVPVVLIKLFG